MRLVVVESPFAGDQALDKKSPEYRLQVERNIAYARACMRDCLDRGEAPYASHILFTQEGIIDDTIAEERAKGIEAGLQWGAYAALSAVYVDLGISTGMRQGIERARKEHRKVEFRSICEWPNEAIVALLDYWAEQSSTECCESSRHYRSCPSLEIAGVVAQRWPRIREIITARTTFPMGWVSSEKVG